jgi:hypothetical protein
MIGRSGPIEVRVWWLASVILLCVAVSAQQAPQKLVNDDIIKMTREGFSEGVIVAVIEQSVPAFDVSVSALTALKDAGVSSKVMEAMLKAEAGKHSSSESPRATAPPVWSQRLLRRPPHPPQLRRLRRWFRTRGWPGCPRWAAAR